MNYFVSLFFLCVFVIGCVCIITDMVTNKDGGIENDELKNL